jgi:acyl-ACP thioesterase
MKAAHYVCVLVPDEFPPSPPVGRIVTLRERVGLGDTRPDARVRLDALARYLQDVADEDAATAPLGDDRHVWVLRRLAVDLASTPRFRDTVTLSTWCSGSGARWAERRTDVTRDGRDDVAVRGVGLWVHVDRATGRPARLAPGFEEIWGASARGRRVSARLEHEAPPAAAPRERWPLRATDVDLVGHVNNAAYWHAVEELLARRPTLRVARAAIEFRSGVLPGEDVDLVARDLDDGFSCWFMVGEEVRASALVHSRK